MSRLLTFPCVRCLADVQVQPQQALLVDQGREAEFNCPGGHIESWPVTTPDRWSQLIAAGVPHETPTPPTGRLQS